jgi:hypothetical protein
MKYAKSTWLSDQITILALRQRVPFVLRRALFAIANAIDTVTLWFTRQQ